MTKCSANPKKYYLEFIDQYTKVNVLLHTTMLYFVTESYLLDRLLDFRSRALVAKRAILDGKKNRRKMRGRIVQIFWVIAFLVRSYKN